VISRVLDLHEADRLLELSSGKQPMEGQIDLFTLLAMIVAVVAVLKLRSVLGRKTDEDDARIERRAREEVRTGTTGAGSDKVVSLPRRDRSDEPVAETRVDTAEAENKLREFAKGDPGIAEGLLAIRKLDPDFEPEQFVAGARQAYEIIVTSFAEGNRKALRDLLSKDVLESFTGAISEREARGEKIEQNFVGINKADILEAEVKSGIANITVRFVSQLITATRDKGGTVVSGDPTRISDVTDIWTFSRDISTARARSNPNWRLVATQDAH
jgi:predicted lipid-binding transport protein (Tim44 family)